MGDEKDDEFLDLALRAVKKIERSSSEDDLATNLSRAGTVVDVERVGGSDGSSKGFALPFDDSRTRQHRFPSITSLGSPLPSLGSPAARRDISSEQQGAARRRPDPSSRPESGETLYICDKGHLKFLHRPPVSAEERLRWLEDDEGASGRSRAHCKAPSEEEAAGRLKMVTSSPVPIWENLQWLDEAPIRKGRRSCVPKFLKRLWTGAGIDF